MPINSHLHSSNWVRSRMRSGHRRWLCRCAGLAWHDSSCLKTAIDCFSLWRRQCCLTCVFIRWFWWQWCWASLAHPWHRTRSLSW